MELHLENKVLFKVPHPLTPREIYNLLPLSPIDFYLLNNGKRVSNNDTDLTGKVDILFRLVGGKGGFGSMLRAIGAQIEKTTNREACRDLSGRRLRDINEEQRLKKWIEAQAEREQETVNKKQKKLERLMEQPKHEFKDDEYDKIRSALPEKVEDAVIQGLQASCSTKRNLDDPKSAPKRKKPKLWIDDDLSGSDSSVSEEDEDSELPSNKKEIAEARK